MRSSAYRCALCGGDTRLMSAPYYRQRFLSLFVVRSFAIQPRDIRHLSRHKWRKRRLKFDQSGKVEDFSRGMLAFLDFPELPHGQRGFAPFESPRSAQAVALNLIMPCNGDYSGRLYLKKLPHLRSRKSERFLLSP